MSFGIDDVIKQARTITPDTERNADEVYRHALASAAKHPLPVGYVVKAVVRCNQYESFRSVACDWSVTVEERHEALETRVRGLLNTHLIHAHPYLRGWERKRIIEAIHFNLRNFDR